jgi:hypothetical protein
VVVLATLSQGRNACRGMRSCGVARFLCKTTSIKVELGKNARPQGRSVSTWCGLLPSVCHCAKSSNRVAWPALSPRNINDLAARKRVGAI